MTKERSFLIRIGILVFLGAVLLVWIVNFTVSVIDPSYDGSQINNIFMTIAGSGFLVRALLDKAVNTEGADQ